MDGFSIGAVVTGLASGLVSSALTYFATRSKIRLEMTVDYDRALHDMRLKLYKQLWPMTKPLARYTRESPLTYDVVRKVSEEMRDWYFGEGGIYLSKDSRTPYFALKRLMENVLIQDSTRKIDEELCDNILGAANQLRTSLADDIGTRRGPWL